MTTAVNTVWATVNTATALTPVIFTWSRVSTTHAPALVNITSPPIDVTQPPRNFKHTNTYRITTSNTTGMDKTLATHYYTTYNVTFLCTIF